jgi:hypothetical protein
MKDKVAAAMPKFFETWSAKFDSVFTRPSQRDYFRIYLAGILGDTDRKNVWQMAESTVGVNYHNIHHFISQSPWSAEDINQRRLEILQACRQTRVRDGFELILDDSGHRKSGSATAGVGRQYLGQIGKVDNGVVMVTSHAFDGVKGVPIDIELYKHASSLEEGKEDAEFKKKPAIAIELIDKCLERGMTPGLILLDAGYGNNAPLLKEVEERQLKYVAAISKNRRFFYKMAGQKEREKHGIEEIAKSLPPEKFVAVQLNLEKPRCAWVAKAEVYVPKLSGKHILAIQINMPTFSEASEVDYFLTNEVEEIATEEWIATAYSKRNWVEVFYRESKGWLGITDYEVRTAESMQKHWALVLVAHSLIQYQQLTGGLRRWSLNPLTTFTEALTAYKNAVEFLLLTWITTCPDLFAAHRSAQGLFWG